MSVSCLQIFELESIGLARVGAFHVNNFDYTRGNMLQWPFPTGFQQNLVAGVQEMSHQWDDLALLEHRFATRDFDQSAAGTELFNLTADLLDGHLAAAIKTVFTVAPRATQVAAGQANEDARQARMR